MPLEQTEDGDHELIDDLACCLSSPARRPVLYRLLEHNSQEAELTPEDAHLGNRELESFNRELFHVDLPLLEEKGVIR